MIPGTNWCCCSLFSWNSLVMIYQSDDLWASMVYNEVARTLGTGVCNR